MLSTNKLVKVNDETIISTNYIRWIQKQDQCFLVCNRLDGCVKKGGTHVLCKTDNPDFYKEVKNLFENSS